MFLLSSGYYDEDNSGRVFKEVGHLEHKVHVRNLFIACVEIYRRLSIMSCPVCKDALR
jgi:hypothetical protein